MKRLMLIVYVLIILYLPVTGYSGPKADYDEAYAIYVTAGASMAAYNDRLGELANRYLEQDGWQVDRYIQPPGVSGVRFVIAKKDLPAGNTFYLLAITGTETAGDIKTNLKVDKIYFSGSTPDEFTANAAKQAVPDTEPKVHKGFSEFIQTSAAAMLRDIDERSFLLTELLHMKPGDKLYLTGHSLGGAAAILAGAQLVCQGIPPEQIEIVTFGSPAVGNAAFAAKFEPLLRVTRVVISGDPVPGVLQALVGGYKQFGREIKWQPAATDPHELTGYLDLAIKNYYTRQQQALQAGINLNTPADDQTGAFASVYIAPLVNNLPAGLTPEFGYMQEALSGEYRKTLPGTILGNNSSGRNWRAEAVAAGCRWVIVPEVSGLRLQQKKNIYHVTFQQTIYDAATGTAINTAIFSTATYHLTPLTAFIHTLKGASDGNAVLFKSLDPAAPSEKTQ